MNREWLSLVLGCLPAVRADPNRTLQNVQASNSVDRHILGSSEPLIDGFLGSKTVKWSVGCLFEDCSSSVPCLSVVCTFWFFMTFPSLFSCYIVYWLYKWTNCFLRACGKALLLLLQHISLVLASSWIIIAQPTNPSKGKNQRAAALSENWVPSFF